MYSGIDLIGHYNYWVTIVLMMMGLYIVIVSNNLVKQLIGLGVFQTSVLLFYISVAWVEGSVAPILVEGQYSYSNPLPHVLMLTAIVVGVATISVGLAIAVRIKQAYGTIDESEIIAEDNAELAGKTRPKKRESSASSRRSGS